MCVFAIDLFLSRVCLLVFPGKLYRRIRVAELQGPRVSGVGESTLLPRPLDAPRRRRRVGGPLPPHVPPQEEALPREEQVPLLPMEEIKSPAPGTLGRPGRRLSQRYLS